MRFWSRQPRSSSGADGAKKARDYLDEDSIFGSGDLAGQFAPVRDQLYFLLRRRMGRSARDTSGSTTLPSSPSAHLNWHATAFRRFRGTPAQRLRGVNEALKARGWRGAGLWVSAQACGEGFVSGFWSREKSAEYWRTRLRWSREAGIGILEDRLGRRQFDPQWRSCWRN